MLVQASKIEQILQIIWQDSLKMKMKISSDDENKHSMVLGPL